MMSKDWRAHGKGAGLFAALFTAGVALAGCDSQVGVSAPPLVRDPAAPAPSSTPAPSPTPKPSGNPGVVGSSCVSSDPSFLCIGVKFVSYVDSSGVPAVTQ